jgi:hypothetical protein
MLDRTRLVCAIVSAAVVLVPAAATAQDTAAAEALFNKGVAQMEAGRYADGCPALEESYRLDPKAGTLYALADCDARWNKLASAVAHYEDYLGVVSRLPADQQARHRDREATARKEIARLGPSVPQLALVLAASAPRDTVVKRDGVVLRGAALGTALPVDPGEHVVTTQVPGGPEHAVRVTLAAGDKKRVELEVKQPASPGVTPAPSGSAVSPTAHTRPERGAASGPEPGGSRRTWAWVAGGVGAAGLLAGTVTGAMVLGKKGTVSENCNGAACNAEGKSAADSGKTLGTVSTVCFGVGLAGAATAVVLLLTEPKGEGSPGARARWAPVVGTDGASGLVGARAVW